MTEDGGMPVSALLRKHDPFRKAECRFKEPNCIIETGKDCAKQGVLYEILCVACMWIQTDQRQGILVPVKHSIILV